MMTCGAAGTTAFSLTKLFALISNFLEMLMNRKTLNRQLELLAAMFVVMLSGHAVQSATITLGPHADTYLRDATVRGALGFMDVRGAALDFRGYLRFDLSGIPAGATIDSAVLETFQVPGASRNDEIVAARYALYGLNNVGGNTPQNWDEATFVIGAKGTEDVTTLTGVTDLDDNVVGITETIGGVAGARTIQVTGAPLTGFLQTRFGDGGLATFIISNDDAADRGYGLGTKENADTTRISKLTIEYTEIPEPSALVLAAMLVGMTQIVLRRRSSKFPAK
jgi:hypothetical protein